MHLLITVHIQQWISKEDKTSSHENILLTSEINWLPFYSPRHKPQDAFFFSSLNMKRLRCFLHHPHHPPQLRTSWRGYEANYQAEIWSGQKFFKNIFSAKDFQFFLNKRCLQKDNGLNRVARTQASGAIWDKAQTSNVAGRYDLGLQGNSYPSRAKAGGQHDNLHST